ncbi:MAG: hypothetical protein RIQ56_94 [Candidatus Parcubacteria bacterium]|jgi:hypothetical protein
MDSTTLPSILPADFLDYLIWHTLSVYWGWFKMFFPIIWPWLLVFVLVVFGGVALQILMIRSGGPQNRLPSGFNSFVGSLTYWFIFGLIFAIEYYFWGSQVVDENVFALNGVMSFPLTWLFLHVIGFWPY